MQHIIWHMRAQRISCRTSYLQKTGVLSNLTHFRFGNKNHTHHRKRLIFLSNLSWNNQVSIFNRLREISVLASFIDIHTDILKLLYRLLEIQQYCSWQLAWWPCISWNYTVGTLYRNLHFGAVPKTFIISYHVFNFYFRTL